MIATLTVVETAILTTVTVIMAVVGIWITEKDLRITTEISPSHVVETLIGMIDNTGKE